MDTSFSGDIPFSNDEFSTIQELIKSLSGIYLADSKKQLVFGRLRTRIRQLGLPSFDAYLKIVKNSAQREERQMMVDLLTTNETYFFREPKHFDFLKNEIIPNRDKNRSLKIWSAACSSGEEAYSIAMVLADQLGMSGSVSWNILASDISQRTVEKAKQGVYGNQRLDGIPEPYLRKFCTRSAQVGESKIAMNESVKQSIVFRNLNLNENLPELGKFDVIFLRNMLIYFQPESKIEIARRVIKNLNAGGWLLIGHSESLKDVDPNLKMMAPSIYRLTSS